MDQHIGEENTAELLTLRVEYIFGATRYLNKDNQLHRIHGPAVITEDGGRCWYQYGLLHRVLGPAVITEDGTRYWYKHGKRIRSEPS